jgi:hypothetical protein
MKKYQIEVTEEQLKALSMASEVVARICIGQVGEIAVPLGKFNLSTEVERSLKAELFPELSLGSHYAMHNKEVPAQGRALFDLYQVFRHRLAYDSLKPGESPDAWSVRFDLPFKCHEGDLAKIKEICSDDESGKHA